MKFEEQVPTIRIIKEPMIKVGNEVKLPDPKIALKFFGPYQEQDAQINIKIGLIGDKNSLDLAQDFFSKMNLKVPGRKQNLLHIDFPGLEEGSNLKVKLDFNETWNSQISDNEVEQAIKPEFHTQRIQEVAKLLEQKIKNLHEREPNPDVIVIAIPEKIFEKCVEVGQGSRHKLPWKSTYEKRIRIQKIENKSLNHWLGIEDSETFEPNHLRRYIKAKCMKYDIPTQIILPKTLDPTKSTTEDDANIYWNLLSGLLYKSNHVPWKVDLLDIDTCYMGIAFFRDLQKPWMRTSLAQVFSLNAEGLVLKGGNAEVDRETNSPHMKKEDAETLVRKAISDYKEQTGSLPRRLVIHKTSKFNEDELTGFRLGAKEIEKLELIAMGSRGFKLIRWGKYPPIRGTMMKLPDHSILLYTFGYIPYMDTYPGHRVPSPLEILEHYGESTAEQICVEIMALTKMNWNNAKFCCKAPITIAFARKVGEILRETPPSIEPKNKFKYYM